MGPTPKSEAPIDITIAVPTYNGAARLPLLLEKLASQIVADTVRWEVLIVDNNSQDETAAVARAERPDWPVNVSRRYVFEPRQGAAYARQAAIKVAQGRLIGFLDDDNLPAANWVSEAVSFGDRYPQAGAFGGRIDGQYEVAPPEGFERIKNMLAIRNYGSNVMAFDPDNLRLPPAASLVIRKAAWCAAVPPEPTLSGKIPGLFIQGDDYEPLLYLHKQGWQILYNPALQTIHQIPKQRFEREYLLTLARGCGLATCQLVLIKSDAKHNAGPVFRTFVGSLKRLCLHVWKHKTQFRSDLATACEFEFHLGSLLSPFYLRRIRRQA